MPTLPLDLKKSESDFKRWATSLRQAYSQRQRWALRIDESGSSFWPTTTATDAKAFGWGETSDCVNTKRHSGTTLTDAAVRLNQWRTPKATEDGINLDGCTDKHGNLPTLNGRLYKDGLHRNYGLTQQVQMHQWRTPSASDGEGGVMEMREGADGKYKLRDHAVHAQSQWPTPVVADTEGTRKTRSGKRSDELLLNGMAAQWRTPTVGMPKVQPDEGECLSDIAVMKMDEWQTPAAFLGKTRRQGTTREERQGNQVEAMLPLQAEMISLSLSLHGPQDPMSTNDGQKSQKTSNPQLNPRFVEWLMGMPHGWTDCEHLETGSFHLWQQSHSALLQRILDCYESHASRP